MIISTYIKNIPNVFKDKPIGGTVLGTLTEEEVTALKNLNLQAKAAREMLANPHIETPNGYYEAQQRVENFWHEHIHKRFDIPYAWSVNVDFLTGYVYLTR